MSAAGPISACRKCPIAVGSFVAANQIERPLIYKIFQLRPLKRHWDEPYTLLSAGLSVQAQDPDKPRPLASPMTVWPLNPQGAFLSEISA